MLTGIKGRFLLQIANIYTNEDQFYRVYKFSFKLGYALKQLLSDEVFLKTFLLTSDVNTVQTILSFPIRHSFVKLWPPPSMQARTYLSRRLVIVGIGAERELTIAS